MGRPSAFKLRDGLRMLKDHGFRMIRNNDGHVIWRNEIVGMQFRISHGHKQMDANEAKRIQNACKMVTQAQFEQCLLARSGRHDWNRFRLGVICQVCQYTLNNEEWNELSGDERPTQ